MCWLAALCTESLTLARPPLRSLPIYLPSSGVNLTSTAVDVVAFDKRTQLVLSAASRRALQARRGRGGIPCDPRAIVARRRRSISPLLRRT
jgi:hypothetical protein